MVFINILLCIFVQTTLAKDFLPDIEYLVYNGSLASIKQFPYFAGLHNCGATIISNKWLLTAAHCVHNKHLRGTHIVYVGGERQDNSYVTKYNAISIHPTYKKSELTDDLALLKLERPLTFVDTVKPVKFFTGDVDTIRRGNYIAIGRGLDHTNRLSTNLMQLDVNRLPADICLNQRHHAPQSIIKKDLICIVRASNPSEKSICQGDSGSALIKKGLLVGVVSHAASKGCSDVVYYTNVANYITWIEKVTGLKIRNV